MDELADKCRQMASGAERTARWENNPAARLAYLDIAQEWRKMADQVEEQENLLRHNRSRRIDAAADHSAQEQEGPAHRR
jgi:PHD/YefM family antitoxin component YafN of YafNO toxin-antitoxin module